MAGERILVVDDEPGVRTALTGILVDEGYEVTSVGSAEEGLAAIDGEAFDAVLLDVWLPGMDGIEALKQIGERPTDAEVVMISGHGNVETAVRATKLGAFDFVEKPLSLEKTLLVLRNALRQRHLERRNRQLLMQLARQSEIVGSSPGARKLLEGVEVATRSDAPVLLIGEPGSGRESAARRIHAEGPRAEGPFVEVPCGALTREKAERALLGEREQGGRMMLATGGTLFFEDVDRLDPELQTTLASALAAREREELAPRLIASAAPPGSGLSSELRGRLEVIRIDVPALRERRDDVPLLAERFGADLAREYGRAPLRLAPDCLRALKTHDWPGNIAELRNLMERLLLFSTGGEVRAADLPASMGGATSAEVDLYRDFDSLAEGLAAFERYFVLRVLRDEDSDVESAARRLGLDRAQLERRLKKLGRRS